jgi:hypothetical protein
MCLHKNWFSTYQSIDVGIVFIGNNFSCKIVGVGSIQIKMDDLIVITLKYVRNVPKLRKKLISLGVIYNVGYKCTTQGGVLNVSKGILVVMKVRRKEKLYQLEGRNEINQVVVETKGATDY